MSLATTLDSLVTQLASLASPRTASRDMKWFSDPALSDAELLAGRFTVKLSGVEGYHNVVGSSMAHGTARVVIYGQVKVAEGAGGKALEDAELSLVDDVKALAQALEPGLTGALLPRRHTHSQQLEYPYGWVAVECDLEL